MTSMVPLERIYPNPANIRDNLGDLAELAASIKAVGMLQPLVVRTTAKGLLIVDGHRRYEAATIANVAAVPCVVVRATGEAETELMLAAAMHKQLEPIEQAHAFQKLKRRGLSAQHIALRTGYSEAHVQNRLLLTTLPDEVQELVQEKKVGLTEATKLARETKRTGSGTATAKTTRPTYLNAGHPLAVVVRKACTHRADRAVIGNTGCGQCWETAIADQATTSTEGASW